MGKKVEKSRRLNGKRGDRRSTVTVRRFRHIEGFGDNTDYLELTRKPHGKYVSVCVLHDGSRAEPSFAYDIKYCEKTVREGVWVEL